MLAVRLEMWVVWGQSISQERLRWNNGAAGAAPRQRTSDI